ncbi:MAG: hypothetical protein K6F53_08275 [Lachnospiraceae bacterium]|nr:hypothetical protein [Lachnospiraceae bacterium]
MACIVYQTDKKTGTRYAYESVSYWDREKKQPRSKRKYLGVVDPESGMISRKRGMTSPEPGMISRKRGMVSPEPDTREDEKETSEILFLRSELEAREKELSEITGRYDRTMNALRAILEEERHLAAKRRKM